MIVKKPIAPAAPAAPIAPAAPAAPAAFTLGAMGAPPSRGGSRGGGKQPFSGSDAESMPAVVIGRGAVETMLHTMLALPEGVYASREQLATAAVGASQARSGHEGSLHTARCQTGRQGSDSHGLLFVTGRANDGLLGYAIDKPASEARAVGAAKSAHAAGGWGAAPAWLTRLVRDGFPWELAGDSPARAAGFSGFTPAAVKQVIDARAAPAPAAPVAKKKVK